MRNEGFSFFGSRKYGKSFYCSCKFVRFCEVFHINLVDLSKHIPKREMNWNKLLWIHVSSNQRDLSILRNQIFSVGNFFVFCFHLLRNFLFSLGPSKSSTVDKLFKKIFCFSQMHGFLDCLKMSDMDVGSILSLVSSHTFLVNDQPSRQK